MISSATYLDCLESLVDDWLEEGRLLLYETTFTANEIVRFLWLPLCFRSFSLNSD